MRASVVARFLAGVTLSTFGDRLTTFALAVVIFNATESVVATAGYMLVCVGPRPLGAWLGGPLGDLASPRLAIVGVALTQGAVTGALAVPRARRPVAFRSEKWHPRQPVMQVLTPESR